MEAQAENSEFEKGFDFPGYTLALNINLGNLGKNSSFLGERGYSVSFRVFKKGESVENRSRAHKFTVSLLVLGSVAAWAQAPYTPPASGDLSCNTDTSAINQADTLVTSPEISGTYTGFDKVFDGMSFKGWWQNCHTGHSSSDPTHGAIWRIAPDQHAIYSTQRSSGGNEVGGILETHKKQTSYEIIFDIWPSYGDDGGLFNRVTLDGQCFQTVLDYIDGGSYGGTWGEGGYLSRDLRQFMFNGSDSVLTIPGNGGANWTTYTQSMNPTSFGCSAGGCTQADWRKLWDLYGWNTTRIKFWGGLTAAQPMVHMQSWFLTKTTPRQWVPLWTDSLTLTTSQMAQWPTNPLGFQVHGGGRFGGANGNWYKNIYLRQLDPATGNPLTGPVTPSTDHNPGQDPPVAIMNPAGSPRFQIHSAPDGLIGTLNLDYKIRVSDLSGRVLERFSGHPGSFHYVFGAKTRGLLFVEVQTERGTELFRISRM